MAYMSVAAIDAATDHILSTYPAITQSIALPNASVEGRTVKAFKIAKGGGSGRAGILMLGGTHARELINPELVVGFALRLCQAYTANTGLAFGPKTYDPSSIQLVVNGLDIFMVPMVNPDGRNFCLVPGGDPMWRKNRANHPGNPCRGTDLNRNYDFLWSSGIGTSADSCSLIYKGPSAFSEPETRNVKWLIDTYANLAAVYDIHSYSELVLYPWGDDENQSTDPNQNFRNPAFDGQRGIVGSGYKEYIPGADLGAHIAAGERIRDGIKAVRGRVYTVQQSIALYPTTGTTHDYAYARSFIDTGRRRVLGFTIETAQQFQPGDVEKNAVILEVSAGLMEALLETLCPAEAVQALLDLLFPLDAMRSFRDRGMLASKAGRRYEALFRRHSVELVRLVSGDKRALEAGKQLMEVAARFVSDQGVGKARKIDKDDLAQVSKALAVFKQLGSRGLGSAIAAAQADMKKAISGKSLHDAFRTLDKAKRPPTKRPVKRPAKKVAKRRR
jgi:murein tripeptide amidase MpaA